MSAGLGFRAAAEADIPLLRSLAERIWRACFTAFVTPAQIDYMLDRMYSPEVLRRELREGVTWEIALVGGEPVGYLSCALEADGGRMKLHKVYLVPELHGRGIGRRMIERAMETARRAGARSIALQVNRGNAPAIRAYERVGFRIVESAVTDIGRGFVMDDHIMAIDL